MDDEFRVKYTRLSRRYALTWALKKNEILEKAVEDIFEKYNMSPSDCAILNVSITVMAMKQTNMKMGMRG